MTFRSFLTVKGAPLEYGPAAGIAQLVERNLAKVEVAGSRPVSRSSSPTRPSGRAQAMNLGRAGRVAMQRTAPPRTPVRFRPAPPHFDCVMVSPDRGTLMAVERNAAPGAICYHGRSMPRRKCTDLR